MNDQKLEELSINTIRTLSIDARAAGEVWPSGLTGFLCVHTRRPGATERTVQPISRLNIWLRCGLFQD
jgi:hypothetical protein